jgi:hypothetical protein
MIQEGEGHWPNSSEVLQKARYLWVLCRGGPYLYTITYTTTKSYIISFLISCMLLLGFYWKLWVVSCIAFVIGGMGWCYGLVMVGRDCHYRRGRGH